MTDFGGADNETIPSGVYPTSFFFLCRLEISGEGVGRSSARSDSLGVDGELTILPGPSARIIATPKSIWISGRAFDDALDLHGGPFATTGSSDAAIIQRLGDLVQRGHASGLDGPNDW